MQLDHHQRRADLAHAVWRIAGRDGVRAASVRAVAREAGLSMGSVRHFFTTHEELLQFAMREVIDKIGQRVAAGAAARIADAHSGKVVEAVLALLEEMLPLDEERATEARIYAAFTAETATDPGFAEIRQEAEDGLWQQCHHAVTSLAELNHLDPTRNIEVETERLWALLDGLTAHLLANPTRTPPERALAVLRTHLTDLRASDTAYELARSQKVAWH